MIVHCKFIPNKKGNFMNVWNAKYFASIDTSGFMEKFQ